MIRDEFIKQQNEKKLSNKEMQAIRSKGERVYYTTQITKLSDAKKTMNFSCAIILVMVVLVSIPLIIGYIADGFSESVLWQTIVIALFYLAIILWFTVFLPSINKKINRYVSELEALRQRDMQKQKTIYTKNLK